MEDHIQLPQHTFWRLPEGARGEGILARADSSASHGFVEALREMEIRGLVYRRVISLAAGALLENRG